MSLQRAAMLARATAAPALARANQPQILSRLSALGLSQRTFHQARQALQAATNAQTPAPKAEAAPVVAASSSSPAATAEAPAPQSFSEIVQRFGGWYPFLGLAGVIAVSKEVLILNEEFLLASNFAVMFATLYFALGDTLTKAAAEQRAEILKRQKEVAEFAVETEQALLQAHQLNIAQVDVMKQLKEEHNALAKEMIAAKSLKMRHAARDAVIKRLGDLRSREQSEKASFKDQVSEKATAYVRREFPNLPKEQRAALVDTAIDILEGKKVQLDEKADPVKKLYMNYFNNQLYLKD